MFWSTLELTCSMRTVSAVLSFLRFTSLMDLSNSVMALDTGSLAKSYLVDVFDRNGKQIASVPLNKYLEYLGYKIFLVSDDEQQAYICNFVCFRNCVFAQSLRLAEATNKKVVIVDMTELNKMGGGIHCAVHQI